MVAVGTYALLLARNEYLYPFPLLSSQSNMTVPVAPGQFLNSDEAPWNLDGDSRDLGAAADRHLLRFPQTHERRNDHRGIKGQGVGVVKPRRAVYPNTLYPPAKR